VSVFKKRMLARDLMVNFRVNFREIGVELGEGEKEATEEKQALHLQRN
jgi:hypothetical protein